MSATNSALGAGPAPGCPGLLATLRRALLPTQAICAAIAAMLWLVGLPVAIAVVHAFLIGNAISLAIHLLLAGLMRGLQLRPRWAGPHLAEGFPGWGWMLLVIVLGVALGYGAGGALAQAITGLPSTWPGATDAGRWWRVFALSLVPGLAGTVYFFHRGRAEAAEARAAQARQARTEAQLQRLQSQLEPHMLFNTLANLRALIGVDPPQAQALLDHMIAWLRSTLGASRRPRHALAEEFRHAGHYLALMQVRMGERLRVRLVLPAELAALPVPTLLLQPLVENAIHHGLEPARGGGEIRITARADAGRLWLEVCDDGVGLGAAPPSDGAGFGLAQVRERLAVLFGDEAGLHLEAGAEGGTVARITLPRPDPAPTVDTAVGATAAEARP